MADLKSDLLAHLHRLQTEGPREPRPRLRDARPAPEIEQPPAPPRIAPPGRRQTLRDDLSEGTGLDYTKPFDVLRRGEGCFRCDDLSDPLPWVRLAPGAIRHIARKDWERVAPPPPNPAIFALLKSMGLIEKRRRRTDVEVEGILPI